MSKSRLSARVKARVLELSGGRCEYCQSQVRFSPIPFSFDHIHPSSLGGGDDVKNIAFACQACNSYKYTSIAAIDPITGESAPLFNPRTSRWLDHFRWSEDYLMVAGITPVGRATVERLDLNREGVVSLRKILRATGEHP
jgi:hypothetical protein